MTANETLLDFKHGNFGDPGLKNFIVPTRLGCLSPLTTHARRLHIRRRSARVRRSRPYSSRAAPLAVPWSPKLPATTVYDVRCWTPRLIERGDGAAVVRYQLDAARFSSSLSATSTRR